MVLPAASLGLGHGVAPPCHHPWPRVWGSSSRPPPLTSDLGSSSQPPPLASGLVEWGMISVRFQGKPFNIKVIQVYAPTSNAEESEVERFYRDLQDLLELTPQKDVLFIIGDWNAKVGSQETPGVTGKFGLGTWNEAGQRLIEFCQENALVITNILFQQHKRRLYTWTSPDGQLQNQIDYILCSQRWRNSIQSAKTRP